ncbi:MAG: DUF262 domain-containing protein [Coriobacteriia bacterium]|nr:DUF262 domain-containing protein [Coriobacteriia bacterium]
MQTQQQALLDFLGNPDARLVLPAYQRGYSWDEYQCKELWRDVFNAARNDIAHFAGMIICADAAASAYNEGETGKVLEIIDGQQRLTTCFLMLLSYAKYVKEHNISFYGAGADYLLDTYLRAEGGRKLTLSEEDQGVLFALVDGLEEAAVALGATEEESRVLANYRFFEQRMAEEGFDDELFWKGLQSVAVISILLDEHDDPQEIFESFNSKGVALALADMVRNYLLLAEEPSEQDRLYENYWERVQSAFGDDPGCKRLNSAIRAWLTIRCKEARSHNDREMFSIFKNYCEGELDGRTEELLQELVNFTQMWAERYRFHYSRRYLSYNWAVLGANTLIPDEVRNKVRADKDSFYWQHYMTVDITK